MGDSIKKYFTDMSDREIMDAKRGVSTKLGVQVFEKEYPETFYRRPPQWYFPHARL